MGARDTVATQYSLPFLEGIPLSWLFRLGRWRASFPFVTSSKRKNYKYKTKEEARRNCSLERGAAELGVGKAKSERSSLESLSVG